MGFASTTTADLHVTAKSNPIHSILRKENARLKSLEIENERLKHALLHHQRMRFGTKSEAFNTPQLDLFAEDWAADKPTCNNSWNTSPNTHKQHPKPNVPVRVVKPCPPI
ncbi:MAG: transposase [Moraxellaceae bacterium]|nr:transposase [Moraxellaceae bacterium]